MPNLKQNRTCSLDSAACRRATEATVASRTRPIRPAEERLLNGRRPMMVLVAAGKG